MASVLVRASSTQLVKWGLKAKDEGLSREEWIRRILDASAQDVVVPARQASEGRGAGEADRGTSESARRLTDAGGAEGSNPSPSSEIVVPSSFPPDVSEKLITSGECVRYGGHCWERTGIVLTSSPPQYPEECRHCGAKRIAVPQDSFRYYGSGDGS